MTGGLVYNIYGGGNSGNVADAYVNVSGGLITAIGNVFGGGCTFSWLSFNVTSEATVTINAGATIKETSNTNEGIATGNVFGGGHGGDNESIVHTAAVYYMDGAVEGNIIAAGLVKYIIYGDAVVFVNDAVSEDEFDGAVYALYSKDADYESNEYIEGEPVAVIENTWTEVGASVWEIDESNNWELGTPMLNASYKEAISGSYLDESAIINPYEKMNVLRLQEFTDDVDSDGNKVHWAMVGIVDLSSHPTIDESISFVANQELFIDMTSTLNAPKFVQTAIDKKGYIITQKIDITSPIATSSNNTTETTAEDMANRLYRGNLSLALDVSGSNTYLLNSINVVPIVATIPSEVSNMLNYLNYKIGAATGGYEWSLTSYLPDSSGDDEAVPLGTDSNTYNPAVNTVGYFDYLIRTGYEHKFDIVEQSEEALDKNNRPPSRGLLVPNYISILDNAYIEGYAVIEVVDTGTTLIPVDFKEKPSATSDTIHTSNTYIGGYMYEPSNSEVSELTTKPDFWTTIPNDKTTKWEYYTEVENSHINDEGIIVLYPYYETPTTPPTTGGTTQVTVIFKNNEDGAGGDFNSQTVNVGSTVYNPGNPQTDLEIEGWYTAPNGVELNGILMVL